MKLLLDTHVALWAIADDPRLSAKGRALVSAPEAEVYVSTASVWEIAIKHSLARGRPNDMPVSGDQALTFFRKAGYRMLPITPEHAAAVEHLPPIHADPFDRLLVAQAQGEAMVLLTHDERVLQYGLMMERV